MLIAAIDKPADSLGYRLVKTMITIKATNGSSVASIAAVNDGSCNQLVIIGILVVIIRFRGSRFKVPGSGFRVQRFRGSRFRVQGSEVQGSGFRVQGSRFKVQGFTVQGCLAIVSPNLYFLIYFSLQLATSRAGINPAPTVLMFWQIRLGVEYRITNTE
jgi:hypothetical protein